MVNGMAQRLTSKDKRLATANFADFSFDISALVKTDSDRALSSRNTITPRLFIPWSQIMETSGETLGTLTEEFHSRFAEPLFCIVAALIGFSTLLIGGFSRFGVWREVVIAFGLLLILDGIRGAVQDPVRQNPSLWPMLYLPFLLGSCLAIAMLAYAAFPGLLRRRRRVPA
jgi:lipopolysaccharide export system permease protein